MYGNITPIINALYTVIKVIGLCHSKLNLYEIKFDVQKMA